jgi:quercetin dioxygenase-like cupin family protein
MIVTRNVIETRKGPAEWFTGDVYMDLVTEPVATSRVLSVIVHFTPGSRCHWHTHPHGQSVWVTAGVGYCQRRGGPVEIITPGDRVYFEPEEEHWHGATAERFMTHIAMLDVDDAGVNTTWGIPVTDEEYGQAPASDSTRLELRPAGTADAAAE